MTYGGHKVFVVVDIEVDAQRRRLGVGTRMYEVAAKMACKRGRALASDVTRFAGPKKFWAKQLRKGRATEIEARGSIAYMLTCPAPATLENTRDRMYSIVEGRDPFGELSPEGGATLSHFASHLAWWMGNTNTFSLNELKKIWNGSPELKAWLKRYVNNDVGELYFGDNSKDAPKIGTKIKKKYGVNHWSKDLGRARKFAKLAGYAGRGYVVVARPRPSQIIVDTDAFSVLAGKHHASFSALMTRPDPIGVFDGTRWEGEVITTPLVGKVLEHLTT
jgi:hypothetical protein